MTNIGLSATRINRLVGDLKTGEVNKDELKQHFLHMGKLDQFKDLFRRLSGESKKSQLDKAWSRLENMYDNTVGVGKNSAAPAAFDVFRPLAMLGAISKVSGREDIMVKIDNGADHGSKKVTVSNVSVTVKNGKEHELAGDLSAIKMPQAWFATSTGYFPSVGGKKLGDIKTAANKNNNVGNFKSADGMIKNFNIPVGNSLSVGSTLLRNIRDKDNKIDLDFLLQGGFYLLEKDNLNEFNELLENPKLQAALEKHNTADLYQTYSTEQLTAIKTAVTDYHEALAQFERSST